MSQNAPDYFQCAHKTERKKALNLLRFKATVDPAMRRLSQIPARLPVQLRPDFHRIFEIFDIEHLHGHII
jgi:hypothetical protein